ncbi:CocE/NonD family hydrolase C-terminal non-catalytic domain-containing protein [Cryobacterium adonitolivorans]|uniref:CocE/NonD family hydrolase C-terminal non-catalytic domain-containing protein n=1 Tax=Cryobacterium adonitolivorans TaxID=1259189 RepID=UPI0018E08383
MGRPGGACPYRLLSIHNTQEWPDYYDEQHQDELRHFFDHFLKDHDNGWEQMPPVRYSLLDVEGGDRIDISTEQFPPTESVPRNFYLDGRSHALTTTAPGAELPVAYTVAANPDAASFLTRFADETVLVGYPKAHLFVEARDWDDMDILVLVQKLDAYGTQLEAFTVPNQSAIALDLTDRGATILKYKGSDGRLRVDARSARTHLRPGREARTRRDRRNRNRLVAGRAGVPPGRATALRSQLPQRARHDDARYPRVNDQRPEDE